MYIKTLTSYFIVRGILYEYEWWWVRINLALFLSKAHYSSERVINVQNPMTNSDLVKYFLSNFILKLISKISVHYTSFTDVCHRELKVPLKSKLRTKLPVYIMVELLAKRTNS